MLASGVKIKLRTTKLIVLMDDTDDTFASASKRKPIVEFLFVT